MMPSDAIRIIHQGEDARFNLDQTVSRFIRVKFMVGTHGPFTENFDLDSFTAATRDARLRARGEALWVDPPVL